MTERFDAVVIGGGVIGCSTAWWLENAGLEVAVLERRPTLGSLTTPNALGTIRTQYGSPTLVELAQESLAFHRSIDEHLGVAPDDIGWANRGYVYLTSRSDHGVRLAESLAHYEALGVTSSELLDAEAIAARFPFAGQSVAGIFHGDGSWVDPARITDTWAGATSRTEFRTGVEVVGIEPQRVTLADGSTIEAEAIVVCAGPYAPTLLAQLGMDLPIKITPRHRVFIPDDDPAHAAAPLVINIANGAYWRPVPGGVWLSTASVDEASMPPADTLTPPDGFVERVAAEIEPVSPALAQTARAADPADLLFAGGFQSYPADDEPVIGAVPGSPGVFVNIGHWAGVMLAPASGRLLRDCVTGVVDVDQNPCSPTRFDNDAPQRSSTNKFGGWG